MSSAWWVIFFGALLVFGEMVDWEDFKRNPSDAVAQTIASNWDERPPNFLRDIGEKPWKLIAMRLLNPQIMAIFEKEPDSMTPGLLKATFYYLEICPTIEIAFWNDERIQHISAKCLYEILKGTKAPVKLGKL